MVFVSDASRRSFEAAFGTSFRFRSVIPLYVRGGSTFGPVQPVAGVGERFLLSVGALERRKNQLTALRAFRASGLAQAGFQYVLCGARGAGAAEILALAQATPGVHVLGYVSDAQLRWLYQNARAFVLPSLLEGFGMPALEAARYGLIPIVSKDGALHEAVGGLGVAVAPEAPGELAEAMRHVTALPEAQRQSLQRALVAHAALLTRERFVHAWQALLAEELGARGAASSVRGSLGGVVA
jgi:glycosyltransferase involved in cell wall biosynthesis